MRIGRTLFASLFIISGIRGFLGFKDFAKLVSDKGLPSPETLALIALSTKVLGGLSITYDYFTSFSAFALSIFMIIATYLYHNPLTDPTQWNNMLKNIAIIGALVMMIEEKRQRDMVDLNNLYTAFQKFKDEKQISVL